MCVGTIDVIWCLLSEPCSDSVQEGFFKKPVQSRVKAELVLTATTHCMKHHNRLF